MIHEINGGFILHGDALGMLKQLPDETVQCCITSPPYYGLRDYGVDGQIGLEPTLQEYLDQLIAVFAEVRRVLKKDGTCFVNLGDSYAGSGKGPEGGVSKGMDFRHLEFKHRAVTTVPKKSLMNVPARFAIRMTDELGFIQRNEIIWHKPCCMPYSGKDRFTVDFEPIFFFSKNPKYKFNQVKEPTKTFDKNLRDRDNSKLNNTPGRTRMAGLNRNDYEDKNKRTTWTVAFEPQKEKHYASYPTKLIEPMLLAGTDKGDIVMDPFNGTATTGLVALRNQRQYIGIELNADYIQISERRLKNL